VLLVDDDRWFDQSPVYEAALRAAELPYDRWEVKGVFGSGSPPREVLTWYPAVVWFNGYDWFDPIHSSELARLVGYLDAGGRLFLSSQDALSYVGDSDFARDYLGVLSYSEALSQTVVEGVPGHPLGEGLGPVALDYPFKNWSDSLAPAPGTRVALRGGHGQPGALTREGACTAGPAGCRWRSTFFSFPFEALPESERQALMPRAVGWLSWLGGSELRVDRAVAGVGESVGYTLTVRNDGPGTVHGGTVSNTLPGGTTLVDGPHGGAAYDPAARRVTWEGDLAPGDALSFTYRLRLDPAPSSGTAHVPLHNRAEFALTEQGIRFRREAVLRVGAPDLATSALTLAYPAVTESTGTPHRAGAATEVQVTLTLRNIGLADAPAAWVDNPLPWTMRLVTGTLAWSGQGTGTELARENRIRWQGELGRDALVTVTYRALAPATLTETWAYNAARLEDGLGGAWERGDWLNAGPNRYYLPIAPKNGPLGRGG
jgi:uncharacterized repeat protein (TIGR01451 family)